MADLGSNRRPDRGQIILVAAFLLAVTFVVLALVVNSAIFTENLATRDDVAGSHDALDHRAEVQASVGTVLRSVNNDSSQTESERTDNLTKNLDNVSEGGGLHQSTQGRLVDVSWDDSNYEPGTLIAQHNSSRNFTSADFEYDDWELTEEDDFDIRDFRINVTEPEQELLDIGLSTDDPFRVVANDTDPDTAWSMEIAYDSSLASGGIVIEVDHPDHDAVTCTREDVGDYAVIDVTSATVEGESCHALSQLQDEGGTSMWFGTGIDDEYRIEFENADQIKGTYSFIGDASMSTSMADDHPEPEPDDTVIYSVTVGYEFYTSQVAYETDVRVAPGEVPS